MLLFQVYYEGFPNIPNLFYDIFIESIFSSFTIYYFLFIFVTRDPL